MRGEVERDRLAHALQCPFGGAIDRTVGRAPGRGEHDEQNEEHLAPEDLGRFHGDVGSGVAGG